MRVADISQYQGAPNFDQLKTGISGIVIRAGYSGPGQDPQLRRSQSEARRVGLPIWYYWFAYPGRKSAEADADDFLNIAQPTAGEGLVLDFEVAEGGPQWCEAFLNQLNRRLGGYKGIVYTNQNRVVTLNWSGVRNNNHGLWVAIFDNNPNSDVNTAGWEYAMKQYTADGRLPGIGGAVDLNEFYGDQNQYRAFGVGGTNVAEKIDLYGGRILTEDILGRDRGQTHGGAYDDDIRANRVGRDLTNGELYGLWTSAEAIAAADLRIRQNEFFNKYKDVVAELSERPTKAQLDAALAKVAEEAKAVEEAQKALAEAKNKQTADTQLLDEGGSWLKKLIDRIWKR